MYMLTMVWYYLQLTIINQSLVSSLGVNVLQVSNIDEAAYSCELDLFSICFLFPLIASKYHRVLNLCMVEFLVNIRE